MGRNLIWFCLLLFMRRPHCKTSTLNRHHSECCTANCKDKRARMRSFIFALTYGLVATDTSCFRMAVFGLTVFLAALAARMVEFVVTLEVVQSTRAAFFVFVLHAAVGQAALAALCGDGRWRTSALRLRFMTVRAHWHLPICI